jgi:hypothetical protein
MEYFKAILLIIVFFANLYLGIFVFFKNNKDKANINYGLLCVMAGFWSLGMALKLIIKSEHILEEFVFRLVYIPAFLIPLWYFLFTYNYPYQKKYFSKFTSRLLIFLSTLLTFLVTIGILKPVFFKLINNTGTEITNLIPFILMTVYYIIYILIGTAILFNKYSKSEGVLRYQLQFVIYALAVGFIFCLICSMILPAFNNYYLDWFGPLFTLINFFVIAKLIFNKNKVHE